MAKKRLATGYTFDASAQTVTHADFSDITLAGIQLIVNVTDQIIIYNFADTTKGGTLSTDTLTLEYDTTSMSDTDELMILVEDGVASQAVTAASLPLPSGAATAANQSTANGLLSTIDADTGNISTKIDTLAGAVSGTEFQVDVLTMPTTTVTATDLDIRDLSQASDAVAIYGSDDGGTTKRIIKTDSGGAIQVDLEVANVGITGNLPDTSAGDLAAINASTDGIEGLLTTIDADTSALAAADLMLGTDFSSVFGVNTLVTTTQADARVNTTDTFTVNSWGQYYNGTTWDRMRGDATDGLLVNLGSNNDVTVTSGAITETNSAAILADTASMDTNLGTIAGAVSGTEMQVDIVSSALPTGAATLAEQQTQTTALQLLDDTVFVDDTATHTAATTKGLGIMAVATPTDTTVDANDIAMPAMSTDRRLHVDAQIVGQDADVTIADGGNSITVDGTVAATQSGAWNITNVSGTVSLPTGAATAANQSTIIGHVDGIEGLLTTMDADTSSLAGTTATISATPVVRVALYDNADTQITSFGGGTEYTEDAAAASDPVGKANILVRADTPAGITTANGDNVAQRGTDYGAAYVQLVTSSGSFIDSVGGGTQYTEGDTDATITGTAMMMEGAGNALVAAQGTAADGLLVNLGSNNDVTVTGTVDLGATDNAVLDTIELNTDSLAVVGGGAEATALRVTIANDSTGVVSVDDNGSSLTVDGTVAATQSGTWTLGANSGVDIGDVTINNASGASAVNIQDGGNSITVDGTIAATQSGSWSLAANQSVNVAQMNGVTTSMGNGASGTGVQRVTIANDSTGVIAVPAVTTGGATPYKLISAASTNATSVKASAGTLYGIQVYNLNASPRYLKLYNKASAPTVGTDTPIKVIMIPGNTAGAGSNVTIPTSGIAFSTGIAFALVTGIADSNTTAVAASEIVVNLDYK